MACRTLFWSLAATALVAASNGSAQSVEATAPLTNSSMAGYRIDGSEAGFQVITHGVWERPMPQMERDTTSHSTLAAVPAPSFRRLKQRGIVASYRRTAFLARVSEAEALNGLPTGLLDALIWTESRYNPLAISRAGAAGLGQLMPGTARDLGVTDRFDPHSNLWAAARYLRQLLDKFGMVHLAVAAYNAGPGAVERAGGIPPNGETPSYVRNVLAFWGAR